MLSWPSSSGVKLQTLTEIQNDITTALIGSWAPLDKFLGKRWQKQNVSFSYWEKAASTEWRETLCQAVRHSFLLMVKNIRAEPESRWSDIPWGQRNPWGKEAEVIASCFKPGKVTWGRIFCVPPPPHRSDYLCIFCQFLHFTIKFLHRIRYGQNILKFQEFWVDVKVVD